MFSAAGDRSQIDALFPCQTSHRRTGGNRSRPIEHGRPFANWPSGVTENGLVRRAGSLGRFPEGRRDHGGRLGRLAAGNGKNGLAHLDRIAFFHEELYHATRMRARDLHNRLIGFQFDHAVVCRDQVAFLDQYVHYVAAMDILAEFGKLKVDIHMFGNQGFRQQSGAIVPRRLPQQ